MVLFDERLLAPLESLVFTVQLVGEALHRWRGLRLLLPLLPLVCAHRMPSPLLLLCQRLHILQLSRMLVLLLLVLQVRLRKQQSQPTSEMERLSGQLHSESQALSICSGTMKQASTVSGCGHTFCRGCIEEAVRVKGCCPVCRQPAWHRDITHARLLSGVMAELDGFRSEAPL